MYAPKKEDVCENIKQENSEYRVEKLRRRRRSVIQDVRALERVVALRRRWQRPVAEMMWPSEYMSSRQICWNAAKTVTDQFAAAKRGTFRTRALRDADGRNCERT
jgi:hypothetical protein